MSIILETLTDFEIDGLHNAFCLADGHAYQDMHPAFQKIVHSLPQIWEDVATRSIPETEKLFNFSFSSFINSPVLMKKEDNFKICPTASNSIDLVAAVLNHLKYSVAMVEPTFDNLALLLRRRGVQLEPVSDLALFQAAETDNIESRLPQLKKYNALQLVHPNNPTGLTLSENAFRNIVTFCEKNRMILVIDNCFRAYRRNTFDDYQILTDSTVSYMAFEDTGKVWPTQDLKASLVYFSDDLKTLFHEIYNEVYLCVSNFTLGILSSFFYETRNAGIKKTIWDIVDIRRARLRQAIQDSMLSVVDIAIDSNLPVEWLNCTVDGKNDFSICQELKKRGLAVLPGRQFYWNSSNQACHQRNIRVSLMKRETIFSSGLAILKKYCLESDDRQFSIAV